MDARIVKVDVGNPVTYTGVAGTNTGDVIWNSNTDAPAQDMNAFNAFYIEPITGSVELYASLNDGVTFFGPLAGRDVKSTSPSTFVSSIAAGSVLEIRGNYPLIEARQLGAAAANARIRLAGV